MENQKNLTEKRYIEQTNQNNQKVIFPYTLGKCPFYLPRSSRNFYIYCLFPEHCSTEEADEKTRLLCLNLYPWFEENNKRIIQKRVKKEEDAFNEKNIHFIEKARIKSPSLQNTLKEIEETFHKLDFLREEAKKAYKNNGIDLDRLIEEQYACSFEKILNPIMENIEKQNLKIYSNINSIKLPISQKEDSLPPLWRNMLNAHVLDMKLPKGFEKEDFIPIFKNIYQEMLDNSKEIMANKNKKNTILTTELTKVSLHLTELRKKLLSEIRQSQKDVKTILSEIDDIQIENF